MGNALIPDLTWRQLTPDDLAAVAELDAAVKQADGDEPVSNIVADVKAAALDDILSGWADGGRLVALAWIKRVDDQTAILGGRVHPDFRLHGLGSDLMLWAEQQAGAATRIIRSEALRPEAHRLYTRSGYTQDFAEDMMVYDLIRPMADAPLPDDLTVVTWTADSAPLFFRAYSEAFKERLGFVQPEESEWLADYNDDEDFRPDLSIALLDGDRPVGFVTCNTLGGLGWISQIGTIPAVRSRKLGRALLTRVLRGFQSAGFEKVGLHVNANNAKAHHVFESFGFQYRLRRARYSKKVVTSPD